ncbi:LysR substrate-binding domain-containing protein [Desulfosarcina sp.]|uniref:LysR substrate-binding domain-containing protein n=1 Tax=Desulfosarcina sp. TaxID=2027861 RepID=UPI0029AB3ACC|nr:LysR substrate-binding domain-containing protein [Desulfosarcina sp.]MDX2451065.1 LysR substrate-binding domain-containing protein [Desulfosarcina sp.]MDX2488892.1 LysR substrate-binding domain-containing protein [Desulfosarcina sp.]
MNLHIDFLRTFIAVADTKGFTKAGRQVNRSQSAVSMQIKRLEDEVGKPLFERIGKTVKLTTEGSLLIKFARRIVKEHDDAVMALSKPVLKGFIRFGSPEHFTAGVLPKLLARFASSYPDVLVEMRCENSDKIKESVDRGELDIGLCTQISEGGQVIYHDPVVWVTDSGFIVQKDKALSLAVFEDDCIFRSWAVEALEQAGIEYRIVYVSRSISGILDAVRAGLAIAPIVKSNVPPDLKMVGIENGLPVLPISNVVLHTVKAPTPETVTCFAGYLIKAFREKG